MNTLRPFLLLTAAAVLSFSPAAHGGLLMESTQQPAAGAMMQNRVFLDGNRMRIESGGPGQNQVILFRGDKKVMWIYDTVQQTAQEITAADIQQAGRTMENAMAQMQAQMAQMPPEQRRMMEQMMQGQMARMPQMGQPEKTIYSKTGSGIKVGQWTCDRYEGFRNGVKVKELYTIDGARFGLTQESLSIMQEMARFFKPLTKGGKTAGADFLAEDSAVKGLPVRVVTFHNGAQTAVTNITAIASKKFAASLFDLPGGIQPTRLMSDTLPHPGP